MLFIVADSDDEDGIFSLNSINHLVREALEQGPAAQVVDLGK